MSPLRGHVPLYVLLVLTALQIAWHFLRPRATESRLFRRTKWRKSRQSSISLQRKMGVMFVRVISTCAHHQTLRELWVFAFDRF